MASVYQNYNPLADYSLLENRILIRKGKNLFIILYVKTNDTVRYLMTKIKDNYARLQKILKELETHVIFGEFLPVLRGEGRKQDKIMKPNG